MTKGKVVFGLLAIAVAGGAAASGIVGTDALAKWFPQIPGSLAARWKVS